MLSRRCALAALGAGIALPAAAQPSTNESLDLQDPERRNLVYVRIRARADGRPTYMPYRGTLFGKPEGGAAVPLFQVNGFSIARATRLDATSWRLDNVEAGYYGDPATGEPLARWTNPLNGRECQVRHYRSYQHLLVLPEGIAPLRPDGSRIAGSATASMGTPSIFNGHAWMHEDLIATAPNKPQASFVDPLEYSGPVLTATSLATFSALVRDLQDPRRTFVPSQFSYQTMNSWRPFMRMGEAPGVVAFRLFGAKAETVDGVPRAWRERVLKEYPDFMTRTSAAT